MAEPLLRKTFSRLRGREKLPRKKSDVKERGRPAQPPEPLAPAAPQAEPQAAGRPPGGEEAPSSELSRSPGRGVYLQSLEPSSRRWVLGGAKAPEEAPRGPGAAGQPAGEIWYNPIPEDEPGPQAGPGKGQDRAAPGGPPAAGGPPGSPPAKGARGPKSPGPARRLSLKMRKLPELRRRLSLRGPRAGREREREGERAAPAGSVISRYHLDSSVGAAGGAARAAGRGGRPGRPGRPGHLSDGDSPERPRRPEPAAFRPYEPAPQPRGPPALWGRLSLHLYGLGGLRRPPGPPGPPGPVPCEPFCLLQVDGAPRARTGPLQAGPGPDCLRLDHTFHLELEAARLLRALVLAWDPGARRHRPWAQGTVLLPPLFRGCRAQQLAVRLEPQGLLYAKLTLWEQREAPGATEPRVFGLPLQLLVEREQPPGQVPLIIQKCIGQIERRGLRVVGLYRLCGSAAVKKELRDAFERDSRAVCLSEELYPDINVITGILKDYLRELPTPLITLPLYQVVLEAMGQGPSGGRGAGCQDTRGLLRCLPAVERATLTRLLDHLRLVSSFHAHNRMTSQNLAVCFGPVLLPPRQAPARSRGPGPSISNAVDFKRHIEVLHYLLQAWPEPSQNPESPESPESPDAAIYLRPKRRPALDLPLGDSLVVTRPRCRGGPESPPSNRYAGDWSVCGRDILTCSRDFLSGPDYDQVAGSDSEEEEAAVQGRAGDFEGDFALVDDPEAPFNTRLNLKDFDALILDLERELSKQLNVCL
ncbi:LOW QUALITY PROTEIN: rho GTPase-activating protein SYDE1 [Tachyglossus aculeatus]|uniref:LOW QUALITY PROTEIN: rho GTPase-activating protein SYDE1 n=1 Tax=Tachyglossus aculeatus TaxID=9261 RepID=UPI0018F7B84A|nr:LOW QUALITY PROTEIN: rho GTPase-activating protein SYDE1 [Tachyglossus aculeatus]